MTKGSKDGWFEKLEPKPVCSHPEREHYAFGLCNACYGTAWLRSMKANFPDRYYAKKLRTSLLAYKMSPQDLNELLQRQNSLCAICGSDGKGGLRAWRLHIDHDHRSGRIRGLLCSRCNLAIGHLKDDPNLIYNAAEYLSTGLFRNLRLVMVGFMSMIVLLTAVAVAVAIAGVWR